jgi:hypothetical protein
VWVEKDKKHFSVGFSHLKAKLTTVVSSAKHIQHSKLALLYLNTPRVAWNIPLVSSRSPYAHDMQTFHCFEF